MWTSEGLSDENYIIVKYGVISTVWGTNHIIIIVIITPTLTYNASLEWYVYIISYRHIGSLLNSIPMLSFISLCNSS